MKQKKEINHDVVNSTTTNKPITLDIWKSDKNRKNCNWLVLGVPGEGKGFWFDQR